MYTAIEEICDHLVVVSFVQLVWNIILHILEVNLGNL